MWILTEFFVGGIALCFLVRLLNVKNVWVAFPIVVAIALITYAISIWFNNQCMEEISKIKFISINGNGMHDIVSVLLGCQMLGALVALIAILFLHKKNRVKTLRSI